MTDSTDEKPTPRQQRLSPQEEDFELVELGGNHELQNQEISAENSAIADGVEDNVSMPPVKPTTEIKTSFYVDYFDKRKAAKAKSAPAPVTEPEPLVASVDDSSQDTMIAENNTELSDQPTPTETADTEFPLDSQAPVINGSGMAVAVLSQFKSKQESINKQQEQLIQDVNKKIKTATTVTYTAVLFGVVSLAAAVALGMMLLQTKSDVSDLTGTTTALKDDIKNIKVLPDELDGTDPSVDQLNQKVDEQMEEVTALQNKVSLLEKSVVAKASSNRLREENQESTAIAQVEKKPAEVPVVKAIAPKTEASPAKVTVAKTEAPAAKITAAKVDKNTSTPTTKAVSPVNTSPAKQSNAVNTSTKAQNNSKTVSKANVTPKKADETPEKVATTPANDINKMINTTNPQGINHTNTQAASNPQATSRASSQPTTQAAGSGWTVNLASSNKLEDAKNTAARFTQKGVPVTISPVTVKNETRYRLQVKGFKSKDDAAAYAIKAKDALKLDSVWINP